MKRTKTYIAALCIMNCALIISCSNDENIVDGDRIPMTLTATVEQQTRSTADNSTWTIGDEIAVSTTQTGETTTTVKKYKVTDATSGAMSIADNGTEPFYFKSSSETKSVTAWYPYNDTYPSTFTVKTDQSGDGYAQSDLLKAEGTVSLSNQVLTFKHQMAKITLNVTDGITNAKQDVTLLTMLGSYTPHHSATGIYDLLISPQTIASGTTLLTLTTDEGTFTYATTAEQTLVVNQHVTYNVTLTLDGMTVSEVKNGTAWGSGGSEEITSTTTSN